MAFNEPCFGIGHNLSLICQMTSEDIKHQLIIITRPCISGRAYGCNYDTYTVGEPEISLVRFGNLDTNAEAVRWPWTRIVPKLIQPRFQTVQSLKCRIVSTCVRLLLVIAFSLFFYVALSLSPSVIRFFFSTLPPPSVPVLFLLDVYDTGR